LPVFPNAGVQLNAFYDRESLQFFEHTTDEKTTFSGASTDVVAHETGHALLDAVRPELMQIDLPETNAFHESFADCVALLNALSDRETRTTLLATTPDLGTTNFVETVMEDLSDGVHRAFGDKHPSSAPRHALNTLQWQLPTTLPTSGPPAVLTGEEHSFSRVFTGCFYDVVRNLFLSAPQRSEDALWTAAQVAGRLLIAAAGKAPETVRFFQAVGRAMILEDGTLHGGDHHAAIRDAFRAHGIALGSAAMLAPRAALAGRAPDATAASVLSSATRKDLSERLGAQPGSRMAVHTLELGGEQLAKAVSYRAVPLDGLSRSLEGVVAMAPEPVLVGTMGRRAALFSALPEPATTTDEVRAYVRTLLDANRIELPGIRPERQRRAHAAAAVGVSELPTHAVRTTGTRKTLVRLRFLCYGH
jgi:hypothetical protein